MKVSENVKIHCNTMRIMLLFNSYFWKRNSGKLMRIVKEGGCKVV